MKTKKEDERTRITLLLPYQLHERLQKEAKQKGISLNELLLFLLRKEESKL